ncbi:MAG: hypothetical protein U5R31_16685 [Acidimicrobiia bacterium]|nr:hypothetical protein [Acidimicrobiia bacterium]
MFAGRDLGVHLVGLVGVVGESGGEAVDLILAECAVVLALDGLGELVGEAVDAQALLDDGDHVPPACGFFAGVGFQSGVEFVVGGDGVDGAGAFIVAERDEIENRLGGVFGVPGGVVPGSGGGGGRGAVGVVWGVLGGSATSGRSSGPASSLPLLQAVAAANNKKAMITATEARIVWCILVLVAGGVSRV